MIPIAHLGDRTCYLMTRGAIPSPHLSRGGFSDGVSLVRHEVAKTLNTVLGRQIVRVDLTVERIVSVLPVSEFQYHMPAY